MHLQFSVLAVHVPDVDVEGHWNPGSAVVYLAELSWGLEGLLVG